MAHLGRINVLLGLALSSVATSGLEFSDLQVFAASEFPRYWTEDVALELDNSTGILEVREENDYKPMECRIDFCPGEVVTDHMRGEFRWPPTPLGTRSVLLCPYSYTERVYATRTCGLSPGLSPGTLGSLPRNLTLGEWGESDLESCPLPPAHELVIDLKSNINDNELFPDGRWREIVDLARRFDNYRLLDESAEWLSPQIYTPVWFSLNAGQKLQLTQEDTSKFLDLVQMTQEANPSNMLSDVHSFPMIEIVQFDTKKDIIQYKQRSSCMTRQKGKMAQGITSTKSIIDVPLIFQENTLNVNLVIKVPFYSEYTGYVVRSAIFTNIRHLYRLYTTENILEQSTAFNVGTEEPNNFSQDQFTQLPLSRSTPLPEGQLPNTPPLLGQSPNTQLPLGQLPNTPLPLGQLPNTPLPLGQLPNTPLPLGQLPNTPPLLGQPPNTPPLLGQLPNTPPLLGQLPNTPLPLGQLPNTPLPLGQPSNTPNPLGQLPNTPLPFGQRPNTPLPSDQMPNLQPTLPPDLSHTFPPSFPPNLIPDPPLSFPPNPIPDPPPPSFPPTLIPDPPPSFPATLIPDPPPSFPPTLIPDPPPSFPPTLIPDPPPSFPPTLIPDPPPSFPPTLIPDPPPSFPPTLIPDPPPSFPPTLIPDPPPSFPPTLIPDPPPSFPPTLIPDPPPSFPPSVVPSQTDFPQFHFGLILPDTVYDEGIDPGLLGQPGTLLQQEHHDILNQTASSDGLNRNKRSAKQMCDNVLDSSMQVYPLYQRYIVVAMAYVDISYVKENNSVSIDTCDNEITLKVSGLHLINVTVFCAVAPLIDEIQPKRIPQPADTKFITSLCKTEIIGNDTVKCSCVAMGYIGLFATNTLEFPVDEPSWGRGFAETVGFSYHRELYIISIVFAALSTVCLMMTIISFTAHSKLRTGIHTYILLNLCITLLLLMGLIFSTLGITMEKPGWQCRLYTGVKYYLILSSLMWNGVEGFHAYIKLVRVLNSHIRFFILKAAVFAYGVPVVIIGIVYLVKRDAFSGHYDGCLYRCVLTDGEIYFSYLLPLIIIMTFNLVIFGVVVRILAKKRPGDREVGYVAQKSLKSRVVGAVTMLFLLGIPWIFSAFGALDASSGKVTSVTEEIFQVVFVVLISLQGVFIFIFNCARVKEVRMAWVSSFASRSSSVSGQHAGSNDKKPQQQSVLKDKSRSRAKESVKSINFVLEDPAPVIDNGRDLRLEEEMVDPDEKLSVEPPLQNL